MSWSAPPVKPSPVSSPVSMASYTGSSNASGSSREGSPAYSKLDKSNYMNVTNDGCKCDLYVKNKALKVRYTLTIH